MALITSTGIIRTLSLFHLTLAFFLLTNPRLIADQNLVFILGQSMRLPHSSAFHTPSPSTAFLAVILAFLGVSDLTALSLPGEFARIHWTSQAPVRLLFLFGLTGYIFWSAERGSTLGVGKVLGNAGAGTHLTNNVVFTWGFLELATWFWVFILIRDERRGAAIKQMERRKAEEDRF